MLVFESDNIILPRVNKRYTKNFSLTTEYRNGKKLITDTMFYNRIKQMESPYEVVIEIVTHHDIDSSVKPILDSLQMSGIIDNDKNIERLVIEKTKCKRNEPNKLQIYCMTI